MVTDKKKGMVDSSDKKGRNLGRDEEERTTSQKSGKTTPSSTNKTDSSGPRKSR